MEPARVEGFNANCILSPRRGPHVAAPVTDLSVCRSALPGDARSARSWKGRRAGASRVGPGDGRPTSGCARSVRGSWGSEHPGGAVHLRGGIGLAALAAIGPAFGAAVYLFPCLIDQDPQFRGSANAWMDYGNS